MAIKETTRRINFIPYVIKKGRDVDTNPAPTVTVNRKYNLILFSKSTVTELNLSGKFIKFFYEPVKKVIGWQIRESLSQGEMKNWRLVKTTKQGTYPCSIKKLLEAFGGRLQHMTYGSVPIQKYRELSHLSEFKDQTFYFVELVDNPEELRKGLGNESVEKATVTA